jgi:hypothetical protein
MESKLRTPPLSKQSSIAAPTPKPALSPSSGTADNTRSIDIRQFPKLQYSDDLQTTLSNSELLLKKVYRLRLGINSKYHPTTADIDKKYGEVCAGTAQPSYTMFHIRAQFTLDDAVYR